MRRCDELLTSEVIMETFLLCITVLLTHFLTASSLYFNMPPSSIPQNHTEVIFTTEANTETNQELIIPLNTTITMTLDSTTTSLTNEAQTLAYLTQNEEPTEETTPEFDTKSAVMLPTNSSLTATVTYLKPTSQKEDKNETGSGASAHNMNYSIDGQTTDTFWHTTTALQPTSEPFDSVQTVSRKELTVNDTMGSDQQNDEMSSTQTTFPSSPEDSTGSYDITTEEKLLVHIKEHYTTPTDTTSATSTTENNWITLPNTEKPMTRKAYTLDGFNMSSSSENQSLTPGVVMKSSGHREDSENESTTLQTITNFTANTKRENRIPLVPLDTTTEINNSIIVHEENNTTPTSITPDTKNMLPECFNTNMKQTHQSKLVCFITLWTLAMTASLFLGITIFLWVRLSYHKSRMKIRGGGQVEKGGQKMEKANLWVDPKASVQERVEFWYVTGSTLEADRKERVKSREERAKGKKEEQKESENELWIQPRVTEDDISEFWYANRRIKEERTRMGYF